MKARASLAGLLICLLSAGLLGLQIPLARLSYDMGADPVAFAIARSVLAVPLFLIIARAQGLPLLPARPGWRGLAVLTVGMAAISYGYLGAIERIPASLAALIFYLHPLMVLVAAAIRDREVPGPKRIAIFLLAFAGLAVVFGPGFGDLDPLGIAMGVIAAMGAAMYFLNIPGAVEKTPGVVLAGWTNVFVAGLFLPALVGDSGLLPAGHMGWTVFVLGSLAYAAGVGLTYPAIRRAGPVTGAMLYNFEPLTIVVLSGLMLGEVLSPSQYVGGVMVLAALVLASRRSAQEAL